MAKDKHLLQPVELDAAWQVGTGKLTYHRANQDPEEECFVRLPMDCPCYMRVVRILDKEPTQQRANSVPVRNSHGVTIELDYYTVGVKLYVRWGKEGTLKVFATDADGRALLQSWEAE